MNKSFSHAAEELALAWRTCVLVTAYALRINRLAAWLTRMIERVNRYGS